MTVDSIDGEIRQSYGIAWQQCAPGRWVSTTAPGALCAQVCQANGLRAGRDSAGAACASGEARPSSAIGQVAFANGCWGGAGCGSMGALPTNELPGGFCYAPGQPKDADRKDRTVGCYCY